MSDQSNRPQTLPARDARPIPLDELTDDLRRSLRKILDLLNAIREDNKRQEHLPSDLPWNRVDENRTNRVVMIDGIRGTGKTSSLLTLLQNWHPSHQLEDTPPESQALFRDSDVTVRALRTFDFDPNPEGLHPFAALVLSFEPVAQYLDKQKSSFEEKTHRERWADVYKSALMGWTDGAAEHQLRSDLDTFVIDQQDGHLAWHRLTERWREFTDKIISGLEQNQQLPSDGLLVLPIDDLDLQPAMASQLLLALRLLRHPRLVFVLNGDIGHLVEVLETELFKKSMMGIDYLPEDARDERFYRADRLSRALVDKVIPPAHRVELQRLTLAQLATVVLGEKPTVDEKAIREWRDSRFEVLAANLSKKTPDWSLPTPSRIVAERRVRSKKGMMNPTRRGVLGLSLHAVIVRTQNMYTFRDASALRALYYQPGNSLKIVDQLLERARDTQGLPWFDNNCRLIEDRPLRMKLTPSSSELDLSVQGEHGCTFEFPRAVKLQELSEGGRAQNGDRLGDLITIWSFAHRKSHPDVEHLRTMWSPLARTRWGRAFSMTRPFHWPGLTPWRNISRISTFPGNGSPLKHWIRSNIRIAGYRFRAPETVSLQALLEFTSSSMENNPFEETGDSYSNDFIKWFTNYLPVLAAPEFGLPIDEANELLNYFLSNLGGGDWCLKWSCAREESLYLTLNPQVEGGSAARADVDSYNAQNGRITALKTHIHDCLDDSLWEQIVEREAKALKRIRRVKRSQVIDEQLRIKDEEG